MNVDVLRTCSNCGCSNDDACLTADGPCSWVEGRDECSACVAIALPPLPRIILPSDPDFYA